MAMRERIMVHGKKYWINDKECKVLISYHDTKAEAQAALRALEKKEREGGYYVRGFYNIVEGVLGALRLEGYTLI